ncbi:ATPase, T2SS/T4P/T4SS family [Pontibacillus halophilus]|uniref:ATPase, T2SS/T4P/T4SS family n=1 Tax=Pontibacillus halophilus TaxID=516704 RepID=UPI00042A7367|nr:ATPase, T2SS/T4P/T4SS family [Pontibacillus halophilus]
MKTLEDSIERIENAVQHDKAYDPTEWMNEQLNEQGLRAETVTTFERKKSFQHLCEMIRSNIGPTYLDEDESSLNASNEQRKKDEEWVDLQYKAVIGDEQAMGYFISKINEELRKHNVTSKNYPDFYDSLAEAIFHEVWGVSILRKWDKYPNSEAAIIRGTELWIDINGQPVKQEEEFADIDTVHRVRRTFTNRSADSIINEQNPELEIEREDGSRITMIQKPRSKENYIMFRRFIVKDISLEEQARLNTIKQEDVRIFKALSLTMPNTVFAGRVRSAKSTFMKSFLKERSENLVIASIEKHFELGLSEQLKGRLVFETQAKEGDLHQAIPSLLRMEHDYIVVGEIRSLETEGYLQACERGERGAATTYHVTVTENVVPQITRHILDEFPNRNFENELTRVASNIDIVITMSTDRDRTVKRCIGVTEIIWDEETKTHSTQDLIRYSSVTGKYYYSSNISKKLLYLMASENIEETRTLVRLLREREAESPLSDYHLISENILEDLLGEEADG